MAHPFEAFTHIQNGRDPVATDSRKPEAENSVEASCLESLVQRRLGARVRKLRVIVRHDGVILQGLASTYYAKQLAQHAAMDLAELPIVANEIEVC
jgi:hypothetical protein